LAMSLILLAADAPQPSWAGVVTAFTGGATALIVLFTALIGLRRSRRVEAKVDDVHIIVNQQRTDMQRWIRVLERTVNEGGLTMPIDQSIDPDATAPGA
jgi:hypothetical protein